MVFKSFPLSFSRCGIFFTISTTTCLEDDQNNNTTQTHLCLFTHPLPWLLLLVTSSIFVCALCYGFHLLTFLLTCFALLVAPFASPLLRPTCTPPRTNSLKQEESEECSEGDEEPDPAQEGSDGSISDEESLIEIALPSGYYIDPKRHDQKQQPPLPVRCGLQHKWWADCYSMESFQQQSLMAELLAEINDFYEEDNMIEIDLSMGSIKCPRFEIKA